MRIDTERHGEALDSFQERHEALGHPGRVELCCAPMCEAAIALLAQAGVCEHAGDSEYMLCRQCDDLTPFVEPDFSECPNCEERDEKIEELGRKLEAIRDLLDE